MDAHLRYWLDHWELALEVTRSEYLWVNVKPEAKQSVRGGSGGFFIDPKKRKYLQRLADEIGIAWRVVDGVPREPFGGCVRVTVLYAFPWRARDRQVRDSLAWALMAVRPDIDNLFKPLADSLARHCFADDAQVVDVRARKIRFAADGIAVRLDEVRESDAVATL